MKLKKIFNPVIVNAIVWGALMIASSLVISEDKQSTTMLFLLIGGWLVTQDLVTGSHVYSKAECSYFRRLFRREKS